MSSTQVALLKKYDLPVRGISGQHLLIDPNIQRKIIELLDPQPKDWILEIGPGLGALTGGILSTGTNVIAVEKDKRFCDILEGELGGDYKGKFFVENQDVLKTELKKLISRHVSKKKSFPKVKVVSNLPYYITSPILFWLIANRSYVEKTVLMMQKEVGTRLTAQPGNKDYGRLTLALRYYADVHRAFDVSRNCFSPKPTVDSSVLMIDFYPQSKLPKGIDENFFFHIVKVAFGARRKTLLNRLTHDEQIEKSREEVVGVLKKLGIPENTRGEDLLLKDFISLAEALL